MLFQLYIDDKGITLFPENIKVKYDDDGYFDAGCRYRGIDNLFDLAKK